MTAPVSAAYIVEPEDDEDLDPEGDELEEITFIPTCDSGADLAAGERFVDYTDRGPRDVVLSGPVLGGWGPGRYHASRRAAYNKLVEKHGEAGVKMTQQSKGRWSFLVKNLRPA